MNQKGPALHMMVPFIFPLESIYTPSKDRPWQDMNRKLKSPWIQGSKAMQGKDNGFLHALSLQIAEPRSQRSLDTAVK